ncbi:NitT/TauT family transport system ATP-binding protein [Actinacidiphila yanglinensis]|uniref:NitT/TauT family transport system ATP-binding protein n=1 Tax=Actinacidiphila yanglinensis TaxID=310779 RepID=A0A1H6D7R0_9ACTN|nr:ABC transporter ATP-binding protein [Actinacidiphila yanglinensis]SEG81322.1 NitT/TauT family transport system ATP-binding protein [Actinacidiphila yanglinensis]
MDPSRPKLVVEDLRLGHWSRRSGAFALACDGLSFDVAENEFVAIVGPSGCGKTTFLTALAGLTPVESGRLALNGEQITGPAPDRSLVFQQASLFPWRNVVANIEFGLKAQGRLDARGSARVAELVDLVGLAGKEDAYPRELSGGMSQRVNLARALATDPDLLLLDEPFSALDAQTRELMQEELTRVWQADAAGSGKTAVFVTHDVPEAVFLADRVVVFSSGPAHLVEVVDVDLPRPRDAEVKRSPGFQRISDYILGLVMSQNHSGRKAEDHDRNASVAS